MIAPRPRMRLFIDENVPRVVAVYFRDRGHDVSTLESLFLLRSPDPIIAAIGDEFGAIIVTGDRDFKRIVERAPSGLGRRFRRLGRISLDCRQEHAHRRVERLIESVEFEYSLLQRERDRRLIVEITETSFRVVR